MGDWEIFLGFWVCFVVVFYVLVVVWNLVLLLMVFVVLGRVYVLCVLGVVGCCWVGVLEVGGGVVVVWGVNGLLF